MGAGPLYAGRREGWRFNRRVGANMFKTLGERMRPKEAVTTTWLGGGASTQKGCGGYNK